MPLFVLLEDAAPDPHVYYRVSDEYIAADDPHNADGEEYLPQLVDFGEVRIAQQYIHGGLVRPEYGDLVLSPETFADSWPPPRRMDCLVRYVAPGASPDPATGDIIVMALAKLSSWSGSKVRYTLDSYDSPDEISDESMAGTLEDICDNYCASLTLPGTASIVGPLSYAGRATPPNVHYRVDGTRNLLALVGEIAAFHTHRVTIDPMGGATMTDATQPVGALIEVRTSEVVSIEYTEGPRHRRYTASYVQPYVRNIEMRIHTAGACGYCALAEVNVAKAVGGAMISPSVATLTRTRLGGSAGDQSETGYPVVNLVDNQNSTWWVTRSYGWILPYSGDWVMCLQMAVASGTLAEYELTSRNVPTPCAPSKWDLYGYDVNRAEYRYMATVESPDWGALEKRKFTVPTDTDWPVEVDGDYSSTTVWNAPITANQVSYSTIAYALNLIKTLNEQERVRVILPMLAGNIPSIGTLVHVIDDTTPEETTSYLIVSSLTYNFVDQLIVAEGAGAITSR